MRGKELSDDYRYFPDPDLLPIAIDQAMLDEARAAMPELPAAKRQRYVGQLGLSDYDARWLVADPDVAAYFDAVAEASRQPKAAANWIMGEVAAALRRDGQDIADIPLPPGQLAKLLQRVADETISGKIAKSLFETIWKMPEDVDALIKAQGLRQVSDVGELAAIVAQVVADNPGQAEQYRAGRTKVLGYLVGQVMKASGGKANPKQANELLRQALA